jgi:hypothetical protein
VDISNYDSTKKEIQAWFLRQESRGVVECISLIAVSTHVPAIACAFYIGEVAGWPPEVMSNIQTLIKTYSYKNLKGVPESYPGEKI